ncbi:MAG: hypothetical protein IKQ61_01530 [Spirochaetales bacterium]|nr:hypothetical protein [Spirochaetales bacterium]
MSKTFSINVKETKDGICIDIVSGDKKVIVSKDGEVLESSVVIPVYAIDKNKKTDLSSLIYNDTKNTLYDTPIVEDGIDDIKNPQEEYQEGGIDDKKTPLYRQHSYMSQGGEDGRMLPPNFNK